MVGQLIYMENQPNTRLVGIGNMSHFLIYKYLLKIYLLKATHISGKSQLCRGVSTGIEGHIHTMHLVWNKHPSEEEWIFFLIYLRNLFKNMNRMAMLQTVWHLWTSSA